MKHIDDIVRLSAGDWERISLDESIPVPEELGQRVRRAQPRRVLPVAGGVAAAIALLVGIGLMPGRGAKEPEDTFTDPYLAYAEVEKALDRLGSTLSLGTAKVSETQETLDNQIIRYFQ